MHRGNEFLRLSVLAIAIFPLLALSQGETGSGRIDSGQCPPDVENAMVYSPFKPYFAFELFKGDNQNCWVAADCLFEAAGESRKQQFGAVALVMGLIPLTLKDIAWPERRLIHVTKRLNCIVEILVLALGLVPLETGSRKATLLQSAEGNLIARACWKLRRSIILMLILLFSLLTIGCYAGMVVMEVYSKRSALGCPFPFFVAMWYLVALVPGAIHASFASFRRMRYSKKSPPQAIEHSPQDHQRDDLRKNGNSSIRQTNEDDTERKTKIVSAVQGAEEHWPVQLAWGIYYIAGTLIFTSIMAVTVLELVCWVGLAVVISASSKFLAFFLCLVFEKTGVDDGELVYEGNE